MLKIFKLYSKFPIGIAIGIESLHTLQGAGLGLGGEWGGGRDRACVGV